MNEKNIRDSLIIDKKLNLKKKILLLVITILILLLIIYIVYNAVTSKKIEEASVNAMENIKKALKHKEDLSFSYGKVKCGGILKTTCNYDNITITSLSENISFNLMDVTLDISLGLKSANIISKSKGSITIKDKKIDFNELSFSEFKLKPNSILHVTISSDQKINDVATYTSTDYYFQHDEFESAFMPAVFNKYLLLFSGDADISDELLSNDMEIHFNKASFYIAGSNLKQSLIKSVQFLLEEFYNEKISEEEFLGLYTEAYDEVRSLLEGKSFLSYRILLKDISKLVENINNIITKNHNYLSVDIIYKGKKDFNKLDFDYDDFEDFKISSESK